MSAFQAVTTYKPTNSQRSLSHTETAFGLSYSLSAGVGGEFAESPAESPPENPRPKGAVRKRVRRCEKVKEAKKEGQYSIALLGDPFARRGLHDQVTMPPGTTHF